MFQSWVCRQILKWNHEKNAVDCNVRNIAKSYFINNISSTRMNIVAIAYFITESNDF